jgi:predicted 3-demethylubiquinone-9 3-methyltransferase (glyoxalase superfamily)
MIGRWQNNNTKKTFYISAADFSVQKTRNYTQTAEGRMIQVNIQMMKYKERCYPENVVINTFQPKGKSVIDLDYNNITFNEALSFHIVFQMVTIIIIK